MSSRVKLGVESISPSPARPTRRRRLRRTVRVDWTPDGRLRTSHSSNIARLVQRLRDKTGASVFPAIVILF